MRSKNRGDSQRGGPFWTQRYPVLVAVRDWPGAGWSDCPADRGLQTSGSVSPGHSWQDEGYLALVCKVLVAEPLGQLLLFHELEVEKE
jgi:hypothetical protein